MIDRGGNVIWRVAGMVEGEEVRHKDDCRIRWMLTISICFLRRDKTILIGGEFGYVFLLTTDGEVVSVIPRIPDMLDFDGVDLYLSSYVTPVLLAISFLHCKNVEIIEKKPRARRGGRRNRNQSRIKYKVLNIRPMQKILREDGQIESSGLKRALHICRGHFKDYSDKGLFGKYKGIYWWNDQIRGNQNEGVVLKDYELGKVGDDAPAI